MCKVDDWHGLYSEGWTNIVPDAFSHPAKFARGLIRHIYEHAVEEGWLVEDDTVIDPFAGVALGGLDALVFGLNWIGNELETHFVDMGRGCECTGISKEDWVKCFKRWDRFRHRDGRHWCPRCVSEAQRVLEDWEPALPGMEERTASYKRNSGQIPHTEPHHYTGNLELFIKYARDGARAVLLQGDSRYLVAVLDGARAKGMISSPPYISGGHHNGVFNTWGGQLEGDKGCAGWATKEGGYGNHTANLGNMREGDHVKACISSPPFSNSEQSRDGDFILQSTKVNPTPRQLSTRSYYPAEIGSPGQLTAMPEGDVKAVVSSPPYGDITNIGERRDPNKSIEAEKRYLANHPELVGIRPQPLEPYGDTPGQLGMMKMTQPQDTFWSAARVIVSQCHQVLAPGGVAIWVVKDFVRNKKIVPFCEQWRELCESCGFETLHKHRCWLVEDRGGQYALDGELVEQKVERKSFFKRLYEKKYPENSIDYEVVWCMRKLEV